MSLKRFNWLWEQKGKRQVIYQRPSEARLLLEAVKISEGSILEIGRARGGSTVLIASHIKPDRQVYSVDIRDNLDSRCKSILENHDNVNILIANSRKSVDGVDDYGLLFIDGDHTYLGVSADVIAHWKHLKMGGYALYHDCNLKPVAKHLRDMVNWGYAEKIKTEQKMSLYKKTGEIKSRFFVKDNYLENTSPEYCKRKKSSIKNQYHIYETASNRNKELEFKHAVDIGCGKAGKLIHFFKDIKTTGLDFGENIEHCKNKYPDREWINCNLDKKCPSEIYNDSVIVCSDVIEHLVDPTMLLEYLSKLSKKNNLIVISTPERDVCRGKKDFGPPKHRDHVREWNQEEFTKLLQHYDIDLNVSIAGRYILASSESNIPSSP